MGLQLMEGFDLYNGLGANTGLQGRWTAPGGNAGGSLVAGRFNGQAWRLQGSNVQTIERSFTAGTTFAVGCAIRVIGIPAGTPAQKAHIALSKVGTGLQCGILFDANGMISAYRLTGDTSGTLLGSTATGLILTNVWNYVEVEFVISTTVGRITVYLNGAQVLNLINQNTAQLGVGTTADTIHLASVNGGSAPTTIDYDDMYIVDAAAKLGERRVETIRPSADTAQKDWVPDTGVVNFSRVNESVADVTNYVQASTVGNFDLYDLADLSSTPAAIDAVQLSCFALKTDATARNIALVANLGANSAQTADFVLPASAIKFDGIMATKPGGGAWGAADVNALQVGPKVTV